jgi:hypothetical protein
LLALLSNHAKVHPGDFGGLIRWKERKMYPPFWMPHETLEKYCAIIDELNKLYYEHTTLNLKLLDKTATEPDCQRIIEINRNIAKLENDKKKILETYPLSAKNVLTHFKEHTSP